MLTSIDQTYLIQYKIEKEKVYLIVGRMLIYLL